MQQFTDFRDRPLLFIDLEMSGLNPLEHEILEAGALVVDGRTLEIKQEYEAKIKPHHIETADPEALKINGYAAEKWVDAKSITDLLNDLNILAPGGMITGWNVAFDWMFLDVAYRKAGIKPAFDYHKIDVLGMTWIKLFNNTDFKLIKLSEACKLLGVNRTKKHRALADIKDTYEVFRKLVNL